jgi:hypothetical protein
MSQTAITLAFEQWKAQQGADNKPVVLDEFVLANVPGLDTSKTIDRNETLPPASQIVHRQAVSLTGVVNENAVVYSVTLGSDVGDFSFNWIGLVNKATGTLAMVIHAPLQAKYKNASGQQGNVLTRSFLMEYNGAATETQITTPAETWQIDFTARLAGMDERQRMDNVEVYGQGAFFADGFLVAKTGAQYFVTKGVGYIGGVRASLAANANITVTTKPMKVWADVSYHGTLTSAFQIDIKITLATTLANYTQGGIAHYVFALASIDANGVITDLRPKGSLGEQQGNSDYLRKDKNLADLKDAATARKSLGLKGSAVLDVGTTASTVAAGDDSRIVKALQPGDKQTSKDDVTSGRLLVNGSALALRSVLVGTGYAITDLNNIPQNSVVFAYANATNSPGFTGSLIDFSGSNGGYNAQILAQYNGSGNRIAFRTRNGDSAGAWNKWGEIYHTQNKPTAGDVGAVNKTGDTMTGRLTVNSDGSAIMIKPVSAATSSFIISQDANGVNNWYIGYGSTNNNNLSIYNYKADAGITIAETITLGRNVSVTGTITPSSYPNFDARYQAKGSYTPAGEAYTKAESNTRFITAVRFGASAIFSERSNTERMAGGVMTSWQDSGSSNYSFRLRPLQYLLNGAWVTAAYA